MTVDMNGHNIYINLNLTEIFLKKLENEIKLKNNRRGSKYVKNKL